MIRTALRAPNGPAEVIADVLRLLAVVSIVVAAIGWGPLSGLSFVAVVAVMVIPRVLHVRASFDIAFGLAILFSTWSSVLGIYLTTRWWDLPMHFLTNGLLRGAALRGARAARRARRPLDAAASDTVRDGGDHGPRAVASG